MAKNKKKRKNDSAHVARPPPSRPFSFSAPSDGRRHVSYQDLETNPTPPVPRHMVSYADSDEEGNDHVQHKAPDAPRVQGGDLTAAEYRERIMSRESDGTYDANRAQQRTDPTYGQVGAFPGLDKQPSEPFYGPANDGLAYLRMVRSVHPSLSSSDAAINQFPCCFVNAPRAVMADSITGLKPVLFPMLLLRHHATQQLLLKTTTMHVLKRTTYLTPTRAARTTTLTPKVKRATTQMAPTSPSLHT